MTNIESLARRKAIAASVAGGASAAACMRDFGVCRSTVTRACSESAVPLMAIYQQRRQPALAKPVPAKVKPPAAKDVAALRAFRDQASTIVGRECPGCGFDVPIKKPPARCPKCGGSSFPTISRQQ